MNRDKRLILFNNVKHFASNPKKLLRFNLHPHLEREECLKEDIKLLKAIRYQPLLPPESEVHCESFIHDNSEVLLMTEGQLWDFVFSDNWSTYSSLRICEGHLLDTILRDLFGLVQHGAVKTYKMSKFDAVKRPVLATTSIKTNQKKKKIQEIPGMESSRVKVPVKIKFTYYGLFESNIDSDVPNIKLSQVSTPSKQEEPINSDNINIDSKQLFHELSGSEHSAVSTKSFGTVLECGDSRSSLTIIKNKSLDDTSKEIFVHKNDKLCSNANISGSTSSIIQAPQGSCDFTNVYKPKTRSLLQSKQETFASDYPTIASSASIQGKGGSYPTNVKERPFITLSLPGKMSETQNLKDGQLGNFFKVKKTISAEVIVDNVVFETDYDKVCKSSKMLDKLHLNESMEHENTDKRNESRTHLLDQEEHVIISDDDFTNNMGIQSESCNTENSKSHVKPIDGNMFSEIPKSVSFSTINSTETGCSYMKMPNIVSKNHNYLPKKGYSKAMGTTVYPIQKRQRNNVYLRMIENLKMKRLGKVTIPSISLTSDVSSSVSSKQKKETNNGKLKINIHNFDEMVSDYSVKLYKHNKKVKELQDAIPVNENKEDVIQMIENFLEMKYIPHLPVIIKKEKPPVKLHPRRFNKENSVSNSQGTSHTSQPVNLRCFDQRIPDDFKNRLITACKDFIVRKEQITLSNNWQTLTCVTINRKLPSLKNYQ